MKKIFVCSAYRGDTETNTENAIKYCQDIIELGHLPIAPHLYITRLLDDEIPSKRERGLYLSLELLSICDEIWYYGEVTDGMEKELAYADTFGMPIRKIL